MYATTIGFAQFREHVANKVDPRSSTPELINSIGGRPKTMYTGKPGRPRKNGKTKVGVGRMKARTGRNAAALPPAHALPTRPAPCDSEDDGSDGEIQDPPNIPPRKSILKTQSHTHKPQPRKMILDAEPPRSRRAEDLVTDSACTGITFDDPDPMPTSTNHHSERLRGFRPRPRSTPAAAASKELSKKHKVTRTPKLQHTIPLPAAKCYQPDHETSKPYKKRRVEDN